ncbi:MAG: universal stress protein [Propionicimonas sp.]
MSESEPGHGGSEPLVLVGVDGSDDGLRAVAYAARAALAGGAGLWIVNVVGSRVPDGGLWELVSAQEELRELGEAKLAAALEVAAAAGFPAERVTTEILIGRSGEVLAQLSERAELLVVGRRAISGLERMFAGSTSVWVAVHANCPVIVISAASTPHRTGGLRTVAVAVSTWPVHESALEWGAREAKLRQAHLRVVHVVPETLGIEGAAFVAAATADLERQLGPLRERHPEVSAEVEVLLGDPVDALVEASRTVDLLILGVHRDRAALAGSIRGVMAHSHCPVGLIK